ncbi:MAG: fasciclin domain-containing protein [Anaerolineae bacterium]|nr:fasciclin domain-containing protein [Anaerolineae bacterium]
MPKKTLYLLLILLFSITFAQAQGDDPARLRIMQLSYLPEISAVIDIVLDDVLIFEDIVWPFATDYVEVAAGEHTLTTAIVDQPDANASTLLTLEAGQSYSVIVNGQYSQQVTFVIVEETELLAEADGSIAIIVNLTEQVISNVTIDDAPVLSEIPAGDYGFLALPPAEATIGGIVGELAYSEVFTPLANTDFLIVVLSMPSGEPQIIYHRSSRLTITEYLQSIHEGAQFARVAELLAQTDILDSLADDGAYSLFLPVNGVIDDLIAANLIPDAAQLGGLFATHITTQNLPPYALPQNETLAMLAGNTVSLNFGVTDSGYWEIEGAPILWDVRLANGVIYGIDGVINSTQ